MFTVDPICNVTSWWDSRTRYSTTLNTLYKKQSEHFMQNYKICSRNNKPGCVKVTWILQSILSTNRIVYGTLYTNHNAQFMPTSLYSIHHKFCNVNTTNKFSRVFLGEKVLLSHNYWFILNNKSTVNSDSFKWMLCIGICDLVQFDQRSLSQPFRFVFANTLISLTSGRCYEAWAAFRLTNKHTWSFKD